VQAVEMFTIDDLPLDVLSEILSYVVVKPRYFKRSTYGSLNTLEIGAMDVYASEIKQYLQMRQVNSKFRMIITGILGDEWRFYAYLKTHSRSWLQRYMNFSPREDLDLNWFDPMDHETVQVVSEEMASIILNTCFFLLS
jgi:hypothetical protein